MANSLKAEIGVVGGSGIYSLRHEGAKVRAMKTPYGDLPEISVGELGNRKVAFIPRHGRGHVLPPHLVNYRANLWALRELGVKRVLATTTCGSLNPRMRPGEMALLYQFIDFTKQRPQTFYEGGKGKVVHIDLTEPYCPELRGVFSETAKDPGFKLHPRATYGCTEGPRFETGAEIRAMRKLGCDLVGMTNVPECVLARELELCYTAVAIITNFAAGVSESKLTHAEVARRVRENLGRVQKLLRDGIQRIPEKRSCGCGKALGGAVVEV